jgi:RNA ligase
MDMGQLERHIANGLVTVNHHKALPLRILIYSRKVVLENLWDDVTTKCRGLIVGPNQLIVARPFEKFFNLETSYRPETHLTNLPNMLPIVTEKLDGSLGILWQFDEVMVANPAGETIRGIATKGSFHSDHATWATLHYLNQYKYAQWPDGFTPIFEIINEQVQHHVVHYGGPGKLVLTALINNDTGEEAGYNRLYYWAKRNGTEVVDIYGKTIADVTTEDRPNHEGYVLSYPVSGAPPLKVKIKHENFLAMQKIIHSATPRAILDALENNRHDQITAWVKGVPGPVTDWIQDWVDRFSMAHNRAASEAFLQYIKTGAAVNTRKEFAEIVIKTVPKLAPICFAMLDRKNYDKQVWRVVRDQFGEELTKPFTTATEVDEELE